MFIYYILCANSLQAIVHICSYTATLHDSQMHTDRKVCARILLIEGESIWTYSKTSIIRQMSGLW